MPEASTDPFGIGTSGFLPYGAMEAMYPYLTYGPNMALNLLDMQTRANMQGQLANQQMGWNLAQAGGSGNLMDNFARQLYLGGQGPQPGMFSALNGLPSPFIQPQNMGAGFNQMLGQLPSWMQNQQGVVPNAGGGFGPTYTGAIANRGMANQVDTNALPMLQAGDPKAALATLRAERGLAPSGPGTTSTQYKPPTEPRAMPTLDQAQATSPYTIDRVGTSGGFGAGPGFQPPTQSTGGYSTPNVTNLPFFQQFQSGNVGPAWNAGMARPTAPALGINEGVKLPWEVANTFQRSSPMYQNQMLQTYQALGIPPEFARYWMNAATPGYRQQGFRPLGY